MSERSFIIHAYLVPCFRCDSSTELQGDRGGQGLGCVYFASVVLPNSTWGGKNWAEMTEQLGKIVELQK